MLEYFSSNFSLGSFTLGAVLSWILGKVLPIFLKEILDGKREKRKTIVSRSNELCDAIHEITKNAVNFYCLDFDRQKAVQIKADYHNISLLLKELNNDLNTFGSSTYQVQSKIIIDFRQAVTDKIFALRDYRYNADDPIVVNIYDKSTDLIGCLRAITRSVSR